MHDYHKPKKIYGIACRSEQSAFYGCEQRCAHPWVPEENTDAYRDCPKEMKQLSSYYSLLQNEEIVKTKENLMSLFKSEDLFFCFFSLPL